MTQGNYPSKLLADAVSQFAKLPGIGERTALRLVLYLMKLGKSEASDGVQTMVHLPASGQDPTIIHQSRLIST